MFVLAGHDPSGGAGVDADREAIEAAGGRARCIVSAWTEQDGVRVQSLGARPVEEWEAELAESWAAESPAVIKTGLLPGAEHVRAAARWVERLGVPTVVDPVLAASGGEPFLDEAGRAALLENLLRSEVVLTPNLPEAALLSGHAPEALEHDLEARVSSARHLLAQGLGAIVLKAGHGKEDPLRELVLLPDEEPLWLTHERVSGPGIHGSGCRHASTIAACLAQGASLEDAARRASAYLAGLVRAASQPG